MPLAKGFGVLSNFKTPFVSASFFKFSNYFKLNKILYFKLHIYNKRCFQNVVCN